MNKIFGHKPEAKPQALAAIPPAPAAAPKEKLAANGGTVPDDLLD